MSVSKSNEMSDEISESVSSQIPDPIDFNTKKPEKVLTCSSSLRSTLLQSSAKDSPSYLTEEQLLEDAESCCSGYMDDDDSLLLDIKSLNGDLDEDISIEDIDSSLKNKDIDSDQFDTMSISVLDDIFNADADEGKEQCDQKNR